jgi:hypothetical protein
MPRTIRKRFTPKKKTIKMCNQQQNNDHQDAHAKKMTIMKKFAPRYKPKKKQAHKRKSAQKTNNKSMEENRIAKSNKEKTSIKNKS